ncbi:hypothetical protein F0562_007373 [Nyssa sinensis]|uniref:EF-hand domain-containing protein n=1 Tax=Nyssa sinensis TaxID=561372 RepID=A0A5J5A6A1_9ASTE|nr:hypothetical protein F0562_007373 [Nyssa sinensis]
MTDEMIVNGVVSEAVDQTVAEISGKEDYDLVVALVAPNLLPAKSLYTKEQLRQLFRMFDRDGNGYITAVELAHSMGKLGHALTAGELTGMNKEALVEALKR